MDLLNTTKDVRKDAIEDQEKAIKEHKKAISKIKDTIADKTEDNIGKITRRNNVEKIISRIKLRGALLMYLGLALLVAALFLQKHMLFAILAAVAGLAAVVFGFIVRRKWKDHAEELKSANIALEAYDEETAKLRSQINELDEKIDACKEEIERIKDFEKFERYYRFETDCKSGYLVIFTTGTESTTDKSPRKPKNRARYNPDFLTNTQVFLNEECADEATPKKFSRQKGTFHLLQLAEEKQKFYLLANYIDGADHCQWTGDGMTVNGKKKTVFIWYHISLYEGGMESYSQEYDNLQAFMDAVGLSKEDIQSMLD